MPTRYRRLFVSFFILVLASSAAQIAAAASSGTISVAAATVTAAQSAGKAIISLTRTGGSNGAASVLYRTHSGTALVSQNYVGVLGGRVSWASGDASDKTFQITFEGGSFSGSKQFSISIYDAVGAALGTAVVTTVTMDGSATAGSSTGPAARLAAKLGKPARLLLGIGEQGSSDPISAVLSQRDKVDIYTRYLGSGDWTSWNSPPCDYVCVVADAADSIGAVPMYTQYQMANNGDGNISVVNDSTFMATYWARARLLFKDIAAYGKPSLVNVEPDFWGYAEQAAPNGDPTKLTAIVSSNSDCASLPNNIKGLAECWIAMARKYAPKAYVGFPPSTWGGNSTAAVVAFMNALGAQNADFIVEQTLDRDAGCFEDSPQPSYCLNSGSGWYWTDAEFANHLTEAAAFHTGLGNLPVIWWQTPEGVPSATKGGSAYHTRDNRMEYFLTNPAQLVAAGGLAVLFSTGETHQTNITTDAGQFQALDSAYLAAPAKLP